MVLRYLAGFFFGALAGAAIGFFARCTSGTCPLTSNIFITVVIGGCVGVMLAANLDVKHPPKGPSD